MSLTSVKQFVALRNSLVEEKSQLEARLREINQALGLPAAVVAAAAPAAAAVPGKRRGRPPGSGKGKRAPRVVNPMSLLDAVAKVVAAKPLTKPEILKALAGVGYKFATKDPMNSLNANLYKPNNLKKFPGGKWGLGGKK